MDIEALKKEYTIIRSNVDFANDKLRSFNHLRNSMGLVPDESRTPDYLQAKRDFNRAFKAMRDFNGKHMRILKLLRDPRSGR